MRAVIQLTPGEINLEMLERMYRSGADVALDQGAKYQVDRAAALVATAAAGDAPVYGVNTGFGKLANTRIDARDAATLQRNLILSHCC